MGNLTVQPSEIWKLSYNDEPTILVRVIISGHSSIKYRVLCHVPSSSTLFLCEDNDKFNRLFLISGLPYDSFIIGGDQRALMIQSFSVKDFERVVYIFKVIYDGIEVVYNRKKVEEFFKYEGF